MLFVNRYESVAGEVWFGPLGSDYFDNCFLLKSITLVSVAEAVAELEAIGATRSAMNMPKPTP